MLTFPISESNNNTIYLHSHTTTFQDDSLLRFSLLLFFFLWHACRSSIHMMSHSGKTLNDLVFYHINISLSPHINIRYTIYTFFCFLVAPFAKSHSHRILLLVFMIWKNIFKRVVFVYKANYRGVFMMSFGLFTLYVKRQSYINRGDMYKFHI